MDQSIGTQLSTSADLFVQGVQQQLGAKLGASDPSASFEQILDAQVDAQLRASGVTPPDDDAPAATGSSVPESADAIWARVSLADQAQNGRVDAIMDGLQRADEAERDHSDDATSYPFDDWF